LRWSSAFRVGALACALTGCESEATAFEDSFPDMKHDTVVLTPAQRPGDRSPALMPVEISAYCLTGRTARGGWARPGIVAADKSVFPLGSYIELWVGEKYQGRYLVDDTGRDIKGNRIDVWMSDCSRARTFGRRSGAAAASLPR
jgi:3D (Asp-Asp-Asp) domain-containing protein